MFSHGLQGRWRGPALAPSGGRAHLSRARSLTSTLSQARSSVRPGRRPHRCLRPPPLLDSPLALVRGWQGGGVSMDSLVARGCCRVASQAPARCPVLPPAARPRRHSLARGGGPTGSRACSARHSPVPPWPPGGGDIAVPMAGAPPQPWPRVPLLPPPPPRVPPAEPSGAALARLSGDHGCSLSGHWSLDTCSWASSREPRTARVAWGEEPAWQAPDARPRPQGRGVRRL